VIDLLATVLISAVGAYTKFDFSSHII